MTRWSEPLRQPAPPIVSTGPKPKVPSVRLRASEIWVALTLDSKDGYPKTLEEALEIISVILDKQDKELVKRIET